ncbi:UDP-N-acetylglucosamine 2-epimerase [Candidatus Pelagibacter sp.]|nr:UDP-N-acetylglucosamine 2-epimerase [Candidatus Pelagibacter sp.]
MQKKLKKNKKIYIYSVGRSDLYRILPIIKSLEKFKNIELRIILSEVHFSKKYGFTYKDIKNKSIVLSNPKKKKVSSHTLSREIDYLIKLFKHKKPDLLLVFGDRYDMLAAPVAAINFNIPTVHFYGGAITNYAIDELSRHAISKMSHFHFVALNEYKKNLIQMGENKDTIQVIGVPEIQDLKKQKKLSKKELIKKINFDYEKNTILVTFHPVTLQLKDIKYQIKNLLNSIRLLKIKAIFTYPNIDRKNDYIINELKNFIKTDKKKYCLIKKLDSLTLANILRNVVCVVGNSSIGIVEAASFKLPTVNIGDRQKGKFEPNNIINCKYEAKSIYNSIKKAIVIHKKNMHKELVNPYEKKISVKKISKKLISLISKKDLTFKKFNKLNFK